MNQQRATLILDALKIASRAAHDRADRAAFTAEYHAMSAVAIRLWPDLAEQREGRAGIASIDAIHDGLELASSNAGDLPMIVRRSGLPQRNHPA